LIATRSCRPGGCVAPLVARRCDWAALLDPQLGAPSWVWHHWWRAGATGPHFWIPNYLWALGCFRALGCRTPSVPARAALPPENGGSERGWPPDGCAAI